MEPAVTMVLVGVLCLPTAWDDLGDSPYFARLQGEPEARSLAAGGPHSRRNLRQPKTMAVCRQQPKNFPDCHRG